MKMSNTDSLFRRNIGSLLRSSQKVLRMFLLLKKPERRKAFYSYYYLLSYLPLSLYTQVDAMQLTDFVWSFLTEHTCYKIKNCAYTV